MEATLEDLVVIVDEAQSLYFTQDVAFDSKLNPALRENVMFLAMDHIFGMSSSQEAITREYEIKNYAEQFLHRHGLITADRLTANTRELILSYIEDMSRRIDNNRDVDVAPRYQAMYDMTDPAQIASEARRLRPEETKKANKRDMRSIIRLADSAASGFSHYTAAQASQKYSMRAVVEAWREAQLFYRVGNNGFMSVGEAQAGESNVKPYDAGSPLHRKILNDGVNAIVALVEKL